MNGMASYNCFIILKSNHCHVFIWEKILCHVVGMFTNKSPVACLQISFPNTFVYTSFSNYTSADQRHTVYASLHLYLFSLIRCYNYAYVFCLCLVEKSFCFHTTNDDFFIWKTNIKIEPILFSPILSYFMLCYLTIAILPSASCPSVSIFRLRCCLCTILLMEAKCKDATWTVPLVIKISIKIHVQI